jgi:hypothetical protein
MGAVKCRYLSTILCEVTFQKTQILTLTTVRTSHLIVNAGFMLDLQNSGTLDTLIIYLVIAI